MKRKSKYLKLKDLSFFPGRIRYSVKICILFLIFQSGCAISGASQCSEKIENGAIEFVSTLDQAKEIALDDARNRKGLDFEPRNVSESYTDREFLNELFFLVVWGPLGHTQQNPYAVSKECDVYKLPDEFNMMSSNHGVSLQTAEVALNFFQFYLTFEHLWPGMDEYIILHELSEIPGIDESGLSESVKDTFFSPQIKSGNSEWSFQLFTWSAVNGIVSRWNVTITKNGQIEVSEREILEKSVGDYIMVE